MFGGSASREWLWKWRRSTKNKSAPFIAIGYWADDHLFVETVGFGQDHHYINPGIPIGTQGRVEERWRLINDGNTIEIEFRMTDPEHWVGEWVDYKYWDRTNGTDIAEANCIAAQDGVLAGPQ